MEEKFLEQQKNGPGNFKKKHNNELTAQQHHSGNAAVILDKARAQNVAQTARKRKRKACQITNSIMPRTWHISSVKKIRKSEKHAKTIPVITLV